ncbi:MAG TPA: 50S ribosomal protein L35 [Candidatus Pacebacteria bacterium]|nr:MAG: 50S ribosomal protein L35 [Microgenomates group bacterium GW2011_GWB1_45_17]KKU22936.1 MAG: 50S ribosomal protein L35 [Microgenomates group bacterium GW2011_GWA1_46_15]KKU24087.1 MAG: 50S ribosomal protein L35 [Microgenomates group bacterium GW2011_GWC1_46_15]OGJ22264.1 MAG: 50S ribosomal protein L35 [Candidatus Pacebacteria bacterium RIFCSPHIGHO2_01_FULL_46_10]HAV14824.1 50S ribosomal protein L35 [Candidatus Paceibacterota bacterium]
MPRKQRIGGKQKTRKAAAKRFKITATGKVMARSHNIRHLMRHKSKRARRAGAVPIQIKGRFAKKIKQMLGLA